MLRLIAWFAFSGFLCWLCWHFAVWRLLWQLALIVLTFLWLFVGGWLLSRQRTAPQRTASVRAPSELWAFAQEARAQFVARFSEDAAREFDKADPQFWMRRAAERMGKK